MYTYIILKYISCPKAVSSLLFIDSLITNLSKLNEILLPTFFLENFLLQSSILYVLYLIASNNNLYYILLYIFVEIILLGIFVCLYQLELFTGFLWVAEFTIVFISIVLLFYLNTDGLHLKYNINLNNISYYIMSFLLLILYLNMNLYSELELYLPIELNYIDFFDNYYESIHNFAMNDFIPLTLSYYFINSSEFLSIGFLLLIGSVACVNLYKYNKNYSIVKQSSLLDIFNFFKDFINYTFIRKQNLNKQTLHEPSLRSIKKIN